MSLKTLGTQEHNDIRWSVEFHPEFKPEFDHFSRAVRIELAARILCLQQLGSQLSRPAVDTLKGSRFANMKELRCDAEGGVWRVAFAFDPRRKAILLVGGDKTGIAQTRFYRSLIVVADRRFEQHLDSISSGNRRGEI
ncbi:MAG: type II toxin-antitoxin system RelE/ParE family toxin [Terracidiphilus sp.]|nr:type II toxin-antitoxin system RelE/ParE family toxin [Terracidiphilus sp.]